MRDRLKDLIKDTLQEWCDNMCENACLKGQHLNGKTFTCEICFPNTVKNALSLINELTEENERLRADVAKEFTCVFGQPHRVGDCPIDDEIAKAKADTVRKMLQRIKDDAVSISLLSNPPKFMLEIREDALDQIAKDMLEGNTASDNKCVVCGDIIPEGRQVCPNCEEGEKRK